MDLASQSTSYHVQWYVDHEGVRQDVTVRIVEGRLQAIESGCSADAIELGRVAMTPGLVNAHTHLEFSSLSQPIPASGKFTEWIRSVIAYRREHPDSTPAAIRAGIAESWRTGTTLIGDIATTGWIINDYASAEFNGTIFQELLGLGDARVESQCELAQAIVTNIDSRPGLGPTNESALSRTSRLDPNFHDRKWFEPIVGQNTPRSIEFGLSPHAPYSVHPDLFRFSVANARKSACPIAMHLAETEAEIELLANGTGEFRDMLTEFGIWREGLFGGRRPLEFLQALAECPRALVVHGNYLDDEELRFLARQRHLTLVYCPRTHAAFGHRQHPWRRLLELGGSVAIGTDSRASNPDLSLFAELQFLAQQAPDLSHLELLKLGTRAGRRALQGESADFGIADFCLVAWPDDADPDPERNLFAASNRVSGTMTAGTWRFFRK